AAQNARVRPVGTEAPVNLLGAEGSVELASALEQVRLEGGATSIEWPPGEDKQSRRILVTGEPGTTVAAAPQPELAALLAVPVSGPAPQGVAEALPQPIRSRPLAGRHVLVLTD